MSNEKRKEDNEDKMYGKPHLKVWYKLFELEKEGILSLSEVLVCSLIHSWHMNSGQSCCKQFNPTLAKALNITVDTVSKAINGNPSKKKLGLEKLGLITYAGCGKSRVLFSKLSEELIDEVIEKYGKAAGQPDDESSSQPNDEQVLNEPNDEPGSQPNDETSQPNDETSQPNDESSQPTGLALSIYKNNKNSLKNSLKNNNKEYINVKLEGKSRLKFSKLKKNKQADITIILDFWNSYKSKGEWKSHIKYSPDMIDAIINNLKSYTVEEICEAIDNYASVLHGDKYYWSHPWSLSTFLMVKEGKYKAAPRKWWQFREDNFVKSNYLNWKNSSSTTRKPAQEEVPLDDPNPKLTAKFIKAHQKFTSRRWTPGTPQNNRLIEATIRAMKQVKNIDLDWVQEDLIGNLTDVLKQYYYDKGKPVQPGCWASDFTWDTLLSQFLGAMGVNDENLFNYGEEEADMTVEELPTFKESKPKKVGDGDCVELEYMNGV